ncbi:MAG: lipid-A-disaccharide synthase-related protein [Bacillota bacterium]|nr:lipid-A-disaccharide synthase-related protein [Bacillota bacterium]
MAAVQKRVLFLSNGHGEDEMGAVLAQHLLRRCPEVAVEAFPLVGRGLPYEKAGIPILGPRRELPSGGFILNSFYNLWLDLRAGLLCLVRQQVRQLRRLAPGYDLVVGLGDVLLVWYNGRYLKRPFFFLPTAKSSYIAPHSDLEVDLMRRHAEKVFARDQHTADDLAARGVRATYVGNLMMDCLQFTGENFGLEPVETRASLWGSGYLTPERPYVIALLPGSRQEAYENACLLAEAARKFDDLVSGQARFLLPLASGLSPARLARAVEARGWLARAPAPEEEQHGIAVWLSYRDLTRIAVVRGPFGDVLRQADAVLGLAGTGNEQAAGLGKPVVACVTSGRQYNQRFAKRQKKLLGEALLLVPQPDPRRMAAELWKVLQSPVVYRQMAEAGRARMGPPGGAARVAEEICAKLEVGG